MILKKILLSLGMIASLMLSGKSHAQQIPQGPFQNVSAVIAAWTQFSAPIASYAYVDGQLVYQRSGFGPAAVGRYFTCPSDNVIRMNCPQEGPFQSVNAIVSYWSSWNVTYPRSTTITVDGSQVYYFAGFGPGFGLNYRYCANRPGGGYMTNCAL
jgi:hypothetical protein